MPIFFQCIGSSNDENVLEFVIYSMQQTWVPRLTLNAELSKNTLHGFKVYNLLFMPNPLSIKALFGMVLSKRKGNERETGLRMHIVFPEVK